MSDRHASIRRPGLDGLRGIAVLLVLLFHFADNRPLDGDFVQHAIAQIFAAGWVGVDVFFVLSGFLITDILLKTRHSPTYFSAFWGRRVLRILPVYVVLLTSCLFVLPALIPGMDVAALRERQAWLWAMASNIWVYIHGVWGFHSESVDLNHTWSIAIEEQFYLVWPLIVWRCPLRVLKRVAVGLISFSVLLRCLMFYFHAEGMGGVAVYAFSPTRLDGLLLGALLALHMASSAGMIDKRPLRWPLLLAPLPALVLLIVRGPAHSDWLMSTLGLLLVAIASAALVQMALHPQSFPALGRVLNFRALVLLGQYSYGTYLFHGAMRPLVRRLTPQLLEAYPALASRPLAVVITAILLGSGISLAVAVLSYHVLEKRFLQLKDHWFPSVLSRKPVPMPAQELTVAGNESPG